MPAPLAYPTDRLLAVIDEPAAADRAVEDLVAHGIGRDEVAVLRAPDGMTGLDGLAAGGPLGRLIRLVQFTTMDQMPDFRLYQAAIAAGRTVVAVHVPDRASTGLAREVLDAAGAHFMNRYGRFSTEELSAWRGPELDLPAYLRR
jgi:hypothetical protein